MIGILMAVLIFIGGEWLARMLWKKEEATDKLSTLGTLAAVSLAACAVLSIPLSGVKALMDFSGKALRLVFPNPETLYEFLRKFEILKRVEDAGLHLDLALVLFALFWLVFGLIALVSLILERIDHTAMGKHRGGIAEFREKPFAEKNADFCRTLRRRLDIVNQEADWNESTFTPIEAEVEMVSRNRRKRRYEDLLQCLKKNRRKDAVLLVLGNPGAGKSVSLRKLCGELLDEAEKTGKTPVYLNLKKWSKSWNPQRLPDKNDLLKFVKDRLYENGDIFTDEFLDSYFVKMLEDGRWYFVFDSFDEMPCLMGGGSHKTVIDHISKLLFEFLTQTAKSGGIIASRLYKAPSDALGATVTLRLQPFTDVKIKYMLGKYLTCTDAILSELFGQREGLVNLCRNPFYLTLLINYLRDNSLRFPDHQMALYQNFVTSRMKRCAGRLEDERMTAEEVREAAKRLAAFMQESTEYGLECPARALSANPVERERWKKFISVLSYAKICRFGGEEDTVSFAHRRFQEFFLVEKMRDSGQELEYRESIVQNAGLRDALVLYCEVAKPEKAREIAHYCFEVVKENIRFRDSILKDRCMALVNALYFMTEAFRNRPDAVAPFLTDFQSLVETSLDKDTDFVVQIALINSMALFDQEHLKNIVLNVFELDNRWLSDEVMKNCRLIADLAPEMQSRFAEYFRKMKWRAFLRRFKNDSFSLSIPRGKGFSYVRLIHKAKLLWYISAVLAVVTVVGYVTANRILDYLEYSEFTLDFFKFDFNYYGGFSYTKVFNPIIAADLLIWSYWQIPYSLLLNLLSPLADRGKNATKLWKPAIVFLYLVGLAATLYMSFMLILTFQSVTDALAAFLILLFPLAADWPWKIHDRIYKLQRRPSFLQRMGRGFVRTLPSWCSLILLCAMLYDEYSYEIGSALQGIMDALPPFIRPDEPSPTTSPSPILPDIYYVGIFSILLRGFLGVIISYLILKFLATLLPSMRDSRWVNRQLLVPSMEKDRTVLAEELSRLRTAKWKLIYCTDLINNNIRLIGSWTGDRRPKGDEDVERSLAILDCESLDTYNYRF